MDARFHYFRRIWALSGLLLVLGTWTLWLPPNTFPQVPLAAALSSTPTVADYVALALLLSGFAVVLLAGSHSAYWQMALAAVILALVTLIALNQHRFQPWAYQFLIIATVLALARPAVAFALLRWLAISIYAWSAWSKCDFTFIHSLGQQMLEALLGWAGFDTWNVTLRLILAALIPLAELLVAVALCRRRWWPQAVWASVVLHGLLLVMLGPLGLNHKPGVLLWNGYFLAQNFLLFRDAPGTEPTSGQATAAAPLPLGLVLAALIWPLGEAWNLCDHWPAWSVYAPRVERTSLFIARSERQRLPDTLAPLLEPAADDPNWLRLRLDLWSLDALNAPLYPQNRFQLAAAAAVIEHYGLQRFRVVRHNTALRWTGERTSETISNRMELDAALRQYLLNTRARPLHSPAPPLAE